MAYSKPCFTPLRILLVNILANNNKMILSNSWVVLRRVFYMQDARKATIGQYLSYAPLSSRLSNIHLNQSSHKSLDIFATICTLQLKTAKHKKTEDNCCMPTATHLVIGTKSNNS